MKKRLKKIVTTVKKVGTLNLVLMFVGAFFIWFNWQMILLYRQCDSMPEKHMPAQLWRQRLESAAYAVGSGQTKTNSRIGNGRNRMKKKDENKMNPA